MGDISSEIAKYPERRFFNRELSWLKFNDRVLEEAGNGRNPLLERLRFLSISASNLDEFFMVRVAGLRSQHRSEIPVESQDGLTPERALHKIRKQALRLMEGQQECWKTLQKKLYKEGIKVKTVEELSGTDLATLTKLYQEQVRPLLTPMALDPGHPFPFIPNLGFGLVLSLKPKKTEAPLKALIPIPSNTPRFIKLSSRAKKKNTYVFVEDVIRHFAGEFFSRHTVLGSGLFRITRDSDIEVDEKAEDLVQHFEVLLKQRRRGRVIRLRLEDSMPDELRAYLTENFETDEQDIYSISGRLGIAELSQLITSSRPDLLYPAFTARFPERIREHDGDCFAAIKEKDILVHHPYEEFDVMIQFLRQAAHDPDVVAIKQTLYRTSDDSPIVQALIEAAENGKSVTALVELKARFDEATNLRWARDLERAGAHVVYGFIELKTHAKLSLVIRREGRKLQSYTHIGTGNYHAQNAKVYTDLALFSADKAYGEDAGKIFNFVTSYSPPEELSKIDMAPFYLRDTLENNIREEIALARQGKPAAIWAKLNALVDAPMIDLLYEASQAGVQIDLVVRGICCLRPGVPDLSENIRVSSIVGRFLEHARIIVFGRGKALPSASALVYFSSADWMPRNLNRRIEALVRVENPTVRRQIMNMIMQANLIDETNSWDLQADGKYIRRDISELEDPFSAHAFFMENPSLSGRGKSLKFQPPVEPKRKAKKSSKTSNDNSPKPEDSPDAPNSNVKGRA